MLPTIWLPRQESSFVEPIHTPVAVLENPHVVVDAFVSIFGHVYLPRHDPTQLRFNNLEHHGNGIQQLHYALEHVLLNRAHLQCLQDQLFGSDYLLRLIGYVRHFNTDLGGVVSQSIELEQQEVSLLDCHLEVGYEAHYQCISLPIIFDEILKLARLEIGLLRAHLLPIKLLHVARQAKVLLFEMKA